jgi:hypothetical protein
VKLSTRTLRIATLAYLALPMIAFAIGWLRWPIAILVIASIGWFFVVLARSSQPADRDVELSLRTLVGLVVVVVLWTALSGIGGFGYQTYDYEKHNAVMKTLIDEPWPVQLTAGDMFVYYVGYYVVPAAIGKIVGWHGVAAATVVWSAAGIALALLWIGVLARAMATRTFAAFALCGGLSLIGALLFHGIHGGLESWNVEGWTMMLEYPGSTSQLYWAPQHTLVAWLAAALVLHDDATEHAWLVGPWLIAFALLWSPFAALGLAPLLAMSALRAWRQGRRRISWLLWIPPVAIAVMLLCYFAAIRAALPHGWSLAVLGSPFAKLYVPFCILEFGIYAVLLAERSALVWVAIGSLIAIPLYRYGLFNDFAMRASTPALFVLRVAVVGELVRGRRRLLVPWAIGTFAAIAAMYTSLAFGPPLFTLSIPEQPTPIVRLLPRGVPLQYLGRPDSLFFTVFAR